MPAPYSDSLGKKAVEAVKRRERKKECQRNVQHQSQHSRSVTQTRRTNWKLSSYHGLIARV